MSGRGRIAAGGLGAALLVASVAGVSAQAGWHGFYRASEAPVAASGKTPQRALRPARSGSVCIQEILRAQERYGIPNNLLLGIGLQEAGVTRGGALTIWPWSVNAEGEGRMFESRAAAEAWVARRQAQGVSSIDVGCMQVNLRWHPDAFERMADGFDPVKNVDYAARFLVDLQRRTGDWMLAAGSYHSFSPERRDIYLQSLRRNVAVANDRLAGFVQLAALTPEAPGTATQDRRGWTSGLGGGGRRSIYSSADLQPVLPKFSRSF